MKALTLLVGMVLMTKLSIAQTTCNCDHVIPANTARFDGETAGVKPGDLVCLDPGNYDYLLVTNINGEYGNRVTFVNCGGKAVLSRLRFENSKFFRLTGTGVENTTYGIVIDGSIAEKADGLSISTFSSDFEVDHIEFTQTKAAAFHMVMRPECDPKTQRGNFTVKNVIVHDNYVHDVGTEGFYFGHSHYYGVEIECGGKTIEVRPVLFENIRVFNNVFVNTGWDALQVSCAEKPPGAQIFGNSIFNHGTEQVVIQAAGIVVGGGSSAQVYNNWIEKGYTGGIHVFGLGKVYIYNNVIKDSGGAGVFIGDKGVNPEWGMHVNNNTIINVGETGINVNNAVSTGNSFNNNIIINPGNLQVLSNKMNAYVFFKDKQFDYDSAGNMYVEKIDFVGFEDPANKRYYLKADSPAKYTGVDLTDRGLVFDYNFFPREPGKFSKGAFEFGSEPTIVTGVVETDDKDRIGINIYPNPYTRGALNFDFTLEKESVISASLIDLGGASIPLLNNQLLSPGTHTFSIDEKSTVDFNKLADGVYFVKIFVGNQSRSKRIVLRTEY